MPDFLVSLRNRLFAQRQPFLLESGSNIDDCGRFLYAGCEPISTFEWSIGDEGDGCLELERRVAAMPCIAVGYIGYDIGALFEPTVKARRHPLVPDICFSFYDAVLRLDLSTGEKEWLGPGATRLERTLASVSPAIERGEGVAAWTGTVTLTADITEARHAHDIARLHQLIEAGDVYQVNYTYRLRANYDGPLPSLYPVSFRQGAPFGAYLDLGAGRALVSASPERFLLVGEGATRSERGSATRSGLVIETRPIKGTAGPGDEGALVGSEKDRAEHVMIVDVARNDLGRICRPGTVSVESMARSVAFPSLQHLISTVRGELVPNLGLRQILAATFPGASVTGAPKVRAMQLISALEATPRGPYTGAFGRIGPWPEAVSKTSAHPREKALPMDLAMTIRTVLATPGQLELGVGGGIVFDSTAAAEWREAELKASGWARELTLAVGQ